MAFLLLLYMIPTLAPASASAWTIAKPIPESVAPVTIAVLPLSENKSKIRLELWASEELLMIAIFQMQNCFRGRPGQ